MRAIAAIVAFLVLACVPSWSAPAVTLEFDIVEAAISYTLYPSTYASMAIYTINASAPVYTKAGNCQNNNLCNETNFAMCCKNPDVDCDPFTFLSRSGSCICASRPGYACVDPTNPLSGTSCRLRIFLAFLRRSPT